MSTVALEGELLALAQQAARAGGAELTRRFGSVLEFSTKSSATDPVSAADLASERAIREVLSAARPSDAILGEEGGETVGGSGTPAPHEAPGVSSHGAPGVAGLRWVVDPLDGTVNYLYGLPAFAVSIACEDAAGTLVAVILDPLRERMYTATRSGAAYCDQRQLPGSDATELGQALLATGFSYSADLRSVQGELVARLLPRVRDIRRIGAAALDLCWCAAGRLDAYFERGVKPWDIAAGMLICERAGLAVRRLQPVPAHDPGPALPGGVLAAPPALIDELTALIG